jgi:hypothetical protein
MEVEVRDKTAVTAMLERSGELYGDGLGVKTA